MGDYIGWCCWKRSKKGSTLHLCNSDDPGAFKIYRHHDTKKMTLSQDEINKCAKEITEQIYTDGADQHIDRLVAEYGAIKGGTGWAQFALEDVVRSYLRKKFIA